MAQSSDATKAEAAIEYAQKAQTLSLLPPDDTDEETSKTTAVEAKFITPLDPVLETANGERLPGIPPVEALKFNALKHQMEGTPYDEDISNAGEHPLSIQQEEAQMVSDPLDVEDEETDRRSSKLDTAIVPSRTHPLFPPLPLYGPPTLMRSLQCMTLQTSSFFLSLSFLTVIVLGSFFTSIPGLFLRTWKRITFRDPDANRPLYAEERKRKACRERLEQEWIQKHRQRRRMSRSKSDEPLGKAESADHSVDEYEPTEGGPDPIVCDISYYARRVGLDIETFKVQTEDGFIITLWHVYDPREYKPNSADTRSPHRPVVFPEGHVKEGRDHGAAAQQFSDGNRRYPVLMIHGLLQSAGAYCVNDDDSLAFYLAKSGYDVWLGNNRCGFTPEHTMLKYNDPRMWAWNIRQMGVMDLPALVSRVLSETGFEKLGLICHSQGTTEAFVALAKEQRPDLGEMISVFCALAPAVYAGPLIGKMYFKFMRIISPSMFRVFFGIHAFIPFMMTMHKVLPGGLYGFMGYRVFSFLFNWTDDRWDRGLRGRMFQFAPVYVSAESMRWWLGRECFAKQKCILATRDHQEQEEHEDAATRQEGEEFDLDSQVRRSTGYQGDGGSRNSQAGSVTALKSNGNDEYNDSSDALPEGRKQSSQARQGKSPSNRGRLAWYNESCPPIALWIAGSDDLVDGERLLQRFKRGREPHVRLVHSKVIPEYEHLDVIWAMDSIDKVGQEVKDVIWKTTSEQARSICRIPKGCNEIQDFLI